MKSFANPLLNINPEDTIVYDNLFSSNSSVELSTTILPFSYYKLTPFLDNYDRIKQNLNAPEDPGYYMKPLSSITAKYFHSQEENSFLEGQSGLKLVMGSNFFLFEEGFLSFGRHFVLYYQLKQSFNSNENKYDVHRTYAKLLLYMFSLEAGIDNVNLGPGEYGLLLSNNTAPYPIAKLQTEDHIKFLGEWDFLVLHGWLMEERDDYSNPCILALRLVWKPFNLVEMGATRTVLYGGDKDGVERPKYAISEYHEVVAAKGENIYDDRFDNDAYFGYDISFYLPLNKLIKFIKITKIYYQEAATELEAPWQKGDYKKSRIRLLQRAFQVGIYFSTENNIFRLEYVTTSESFYSHHLYNMEGYTYKGFSLGYPYGQNVQSILLKHRYYFTNALSLEYRMGGYHQPAFESGDEQQKGYFYPLKPSKEVENRMRRYFISLLIDIRVYSFIIEGYIRYDRTEKYDEAILPTRYNIVDENKQFYTLGMSLSLRI